MIRIGLILIAALSVNIPNIVAQSINLQGKVVDSQSNAINEVKVTLAGKSISTYTNILGEFNINTVDIDTRNTQCEVYYDGKAIHFSSMGQTHICIYESTGHLIEQVTLSKLRSGRYLFYPSAYLPESVGIKMYLVTVYSESEMHSFKVFNTDSRQFEKGIMYADHDVIQPNLLIPSLKSTGSFEGYNNVDKLIFEHDDYQTKEIDISSYTNNLGTIFMDESMNFIKPAAPSNLTVEATSPTSCKLKWTDNSSSERGFAIERQHLTISGNWVTVDNVDANITTYTHSGLTETWPAYRVSAYADFSSDPTEEASAPAKLRVVNNLNNTDVLQTYNQIVRVRIGPSESSVTGSSNYERLQPSETVYDIGTVNTISPGYTNANSSPYYEDYDVEEDWNYFNYWVYLQCGWWDYIVVLGPPYYWQKTMTKVYCNDGVSECYKAAWINIYNHYSGYFVLYATDLLPHGHWSTGK